MGLSSYWYVQKLFHWVTYRNKLAFPEMFIYLTTILLMSTPEGTVLL